MSIKKISLVTFLFILLFVSCNSKPNKSQLIKVSLDSLNTKSSFTELDKENWQYKDIKKDSILGISLELASALVENKKASEVIVAVIDLEVNIDDKDLKSKIWVNIDEIPNNKIDDDNNGYVDDINGWNFLGTEKGDPILVHNITPVRILRKYKNLDKNKVDSSELKDYELYNKAKTILKEKIEEADLNIEYFKGFRNRVIKLKDTMKILFDKTEYTLQELDSLLKIINDTIVKKKIKSTQYLVSNDINDKMIVDIIQSHIDNKNKTYNLNYIDRITQDNPYNINDSIYGNNNVHGTGKMDHGTKVSSIIAATRNNSYGIDGVYDKVKIMPIVISTIGNEYDKDIALGIRYAVNNGAKIINMSIGKDYAIHEEWITNAIKYAETKNVLIISSAGNESLNLDDKDIYYYPNDMDKDKVEISNNFIAVGSTNYSESIVSDFSNYGQNTVDIFAPGENIKVITRKGVEEDSGTSLASSVTTGVSALVRAYHPNLTAKEVKEVILESGLSIKDSVYIPVVEGEERDLKKVPFSSLSKSGKIVNAYNALLMAEEVSKKKKRN